MENVELVFDNGFEDISLQSQHITDYMNGFESILSQYRSGDLHSYGGMESYTIGTLKASGGSWDIHSGLENFITDGIKKFCSMIWGWLEAIWNFITGKGSKDSDKTEPKKDVEVVKEQEKKIKKATETPTHTIISSSEFEKFMEGSSGIVIEAENVIKKSKQPGGVSSPADSEKLVKAKTIVETAKVINTQAKKSGINKKLSDRPLSAEGMKELERYSVSVYKDKVGPNIEKIRKKLIKILTTDYKDALESAKSNFDGINASNVFKSTVSALESSNKENLIDLVAVYTDKDHLYNDVLPGKIKEYKNIIEGNNKKLETIKDDAEAQSIKKEIIAFKILMEWYVKTFEYMKRTIKTIKDFQGSVLASIEAKKVALVLSEM